MRRLLHSIKTVSNKLLGTKADELFWKFRHLRDKNWPQGYLNKEALNHPHRQSLVNKISAYAPFDNVLEIGCASGPNLYLLAKKFPETKLYGIDISDVAVKTAKRWFAERNIGNVQIARTKADDLSKFPDKSMDVIFTDAVLIYVGPDKIERVLKEMLRVTKKAIILNEWNSDPIQSLYVADHWSHNYKNLFTKLYGEDTTKLTKIPEGIYSEAWTKYGYIIEALLN